MARFKSEFPGAFAFSRSAYLRIGSVILSAAAVSRISLAFFYFLFDHSFWREQYAATRGIIRYRANNENSARLFLLRRNIHRLEKGLSMRPRRARFALDYIQETVEVHDFLRKEAGCADTDPILEWATDVLQEFFRTVESNAIIEKAKQQFVASIRADGVPKRVPTRFDQREGQSHGIDLDSLALLSRSRRSIRWFQNESVPRELLDRAIEIGAQGPSSCNRQPFNFRIFDDRDAVKKLVNLPRGTAGFADGIPCLIVVTGDLSNCSSLCDRHGIYIDAGLSVMGLLYALECAGLGSCVLNWPDVEALERRMGKLLSLQAHERVVFLIAVGWPDPEGLVPYSAKTPLAELRSYNFENQSNET